MAALYTMVSELDDKKNEFLKGDSWSIPSLFINRQLKHQLVAVLLYYKNGFLKTEF